MNPTVAKELLPYSVQHLTGFRMAHSPATQRLSRECNQRLAGL